MVGRREREREKGERERILKNMWTLKEVLGRELTDRIGRKEETEGGYRSDYLVIVEKMASYLKQGITS